MRSTSVAPAAAVLILAAIWGTKPGTVVLVVAGLALGGSVLAAVHHAEVIAHRVGEPFGSLVLAVAVTIIEVALIVTLMISGGDETSTLARDTVFAAVMITCTGIVGMSLLFATLNHGVATFNAEGTASALATVATLSLVLPTFTTSRPGPEFSPSQLAFAAVASLALYGLFVLVQTVRHRDYFLPSGPDAVDPDRHAASPSDREAVTSLAPMVVALIAVVGLAKIESPAIEDAVASVGAPASAVGVIIALVVAPRDARRGPQRPSRPDADELQPRARLGHGQHRAHDPGDRHRHHLARRPARARARFNTDSPARHHRGRVIADRPARARDPPRGRRAPRPVRVLLVPRVQPLGPASYLNTALTAEAYDVDGGQQIVRG